MNWQELLHYITIVDHNNDSLIDKCQTGVLSSTCDSPTDAISDWTLILCAQAFSRYVFLLVDGCAHSRSYWVFFGVATVNIFSSVNKLMLTSLHEYFRSAVSNGWVLAVSFTHSGAFDFLSINIYKCSVATHLTCSVISNHCFSRN